MLSRYLLDCDLRQQLLLILFPGMGLFSLKYVVSSSRYVSKFVKKSERKDAYEEPKFTNLYVKNLGKFVTEDILLETFSEYGKVRNVLIMKDTEGKSKGFGFVNFESYEEAKKAVEALNGSLLGKLQLLHFPLAFLSRARRLILKCMSSLWIRIREVVCWKGSKEGRKGRASEM